MARVGYVQIFVSDMKRAIQHYQKLGIFVQDESEDFPEFVTLATEGASLALHSGEPDKSLIGRRTGITIVVPDLPKLYEEASAAGVKFEGPPEMQPWGGLMTQAVDPDGNSVSLLQEWQSPEA